MQNITKFFYQNDIWEKIVNHPGYDLGKREMQALISFLQDVGSLVLIRNAIHLGVGSEREIPYILKHIASIKNYVLIDICSFALDSTYAKVRADFPGVNFQKELKDVEVPGFLSDLRRKVSGPTLVILIGNGVIFSNPSVSASISAGMKNEDFFLLTLETPHKEMFSSYDIDPAYELISKGKMRASRKNTQIIYDDKDQCLKMICNGETLLSSYKPTPEQLKVRMELAGFNEVFLKEYNDIHMTGSLWRKN